MLSLGRWSCRIPAGFLVSCCTQVPLLYSSSSSPTGHSPSSARSSIPVRLTLTFFTFAVLQPQIALVWAVALSLAATQAVTFCFPFLRVLRCFSSPGTSPVARMTSLAGFPHSDIGGSLLPYSLPPLFAVWRVLLQSRVARHSPCALHSLISLVLSIIVFSEICIYMNCLNITV